MREAHNHADLECCETRDDERHLRSSRAANEHPCVDAMHSCRELREHEHDRQRPMRVIQAHRCGIGRAGVCGHCFRRAIARGWLRVATCKRPRQEARCRAHVFLSHDLDADRFIRASLHASGCLARCESALAHIALPHDALFCGILRHVVGAFQHAVLAADALVIEMSHDARLGVLFVGEHRAAIRTRGIYAMMTRGGDRLLVRLFIAAAVQKADRAPQLLVLQSV